MVRRKNVKNRSVYIEDQGKRMGKFRFDIVAVRQDGMEWSVGTAKTLKEAKAIKKKHLWSNVDPKGKLLHKRKKRKR